MLTTAANAAHKFYDILKEVKYDIMNRLDQLATDLCRV